MENSSASVLGLYGFITAVLGAAVAIHFQKSEARLNLNPFTNLSSLLLFAGGSLLYIYLPLYVGLLLFAVCCCLVYQSICSNGILSSDGKAVLITGCDSGFGHALAKRLHSLGFHVFAMVLQEEGDGAQKLKLVRSNRLTVIEMDVTNHAMIHKVQKEVAKQLGNQGELPFGSMSAYGTSKAALEFFLDILRQEMKAWGVQISIIQPGATKTGQIGNIEFWKQQHEKLMDGLSPELLHDYGEDYFAEIQQRMMRIGPLFRQHVGPVIDTIVTALLVQNPKPRYTTEFVIDVLKTLYYFLPSLVSDTILNQVFIAHKLVPKGVKKG
ncbi:short-chain dehydrogenase/reductase family 9C member 7-like isoform X2 [Carcharodon carcharias]|uniref:short-chain dehydrogenase/reductase family 9C member 7-like isoform X2 n=1 Tax=Carcharodon carcharias TaxID=13397 RepID=UPI001B7F3858|nr:short-chain dehydrogenase/reductase family 9C member 7-like isoform X2 [Carcharodon carcharias]